MKNLRWWVIALVALATVINYIDRQSLSVLWPFMGKEIYPEIFKLIDVQEVIKDRFKAIKNWAKEFDTLSQEMGSWHFRRMQG
mgnify:CR=1 FL=1